MRRAYRRQVGPTRLQVGGVAGLRRRQVGRARSRRRLEGGGRGWHGFVEGRESFEKLNWVGVTDEGIGRILARKNGAQFRRRSRCLGGFRVFILFYFINEYKFLIGRWFYNFKN